MKSEKLRIVYMGTPDFATAPLKALVEQGYEIAGVVTGPDKKAGRGQQIRYSPVKEFALECDLPLLQPEKLKSDDFLLDLAELQANLFIVVAFRMLPEAVWSMPKLGTFNLHASLLPQYRGAAPINHAIINGETKTGLTTFFLDKEIDTGRIIFSQEMEILAEDDFGSLHDRMMEEGAKLVLKTVQSIENGIVTSISQDALLSDKSSLRHAPKIFPNDCKINWNQPAGQIHNLIRGLSPFPAAWTILRKGDEEKSMKIYKTRLEIVPHDFRPGSLIKPKNKELKVACQDGFLHLLEIQQSGKKRMKVQDFLAGFQEIEYWMAE